MFARVGLVAALLAIPLVGAAQDAPADAAPAAGQPAPAASGGRRVAVLLIATPGVTAEITDSLTEALIGIVAHRGGSQIVGKEEFQAALGRGEEGTLDCVTSAACLGRVGVQLGVAEVISGTLGQRGGRWVFNLNRVDMATGQLEGRVFREVAGDEGALADALIAAVPQLFQVVRRPATLAISATVDGAEVLIDGILAGTASGSPVRQEDIPPGRHEVVVRARGYHEYRRAVNVREGTILEIDADLDPIRSRGLSPVFWIGGVVAIAAGGTAAVFAVLSQEAPASGASRAMDTDFYETRRTQALLANIGFAVAGAGVATAVIGLLVSGGPEDDADAAPFAEAGVAPLPGGLAAHLGGAF